MRNVFNVQPSGRRLTKKSWERECIESETKRVTAIQNKENTTHFAIGNTNAIANVTIIKSYTFIL
jgi:hypothetical protein